VAAARRVGFATAVGATRQSFSVRTDDQVTGIRLIEAGVGLGVMPNYVADG
jgi:hypothetical protein